MNSSNVTIIIPTMNEEESIVEVINEINEINPNYEIIVVDKSTDGTIEIVRDLGVELIRQENNGKGNAMRLGVKHANNDIIVFIDGDFTYPSIYIPYMIKLMNNHDFVRGSRFCYLKNTGWKNYIGNILFSFIASFLYGKTSDLLTGLYCLRKNVFKNMYLSSSGFEIETEIYIKARKMKLKIKEFKIKYRKRLGKAKLNSFKDGIKILRTLIRFFPIYLRNKIALNMKKSNQIFTNR